MTAKYKVEITFSAVQDDYEEGQLGNYPPIIIFNQITNKDGNCWSESEEFNTLDEVREFVKDRTYSGYEYITYDSYLKRYVTAYMATDENIGEMSDNERKKWEKGEINGWCIDCDIVVKKYTPKLIGNIKFKS